MRFLSFAFLVMKIQWFKYNILLFCGRKEENFKIGLQQQPRRKKKLLRKSHTMPRLGAN